MRELVLLAWLLVPFVLVYVGVARRRGRARVPWLGAAGAYVLLFMVAPVYLVSSPRAEHGTPNIMVAPSPVADTARPQ